MPEILQELEGCRLKPYEHQIVGVEALLKNQWFFLGDEMGAGKTKQVIDAAQIMFLRNMIYRVLVLAPAPVRPVWSDNEIGELQKHLWFSVKSSITDWHKRTRSWMHQDDLTRPPMLWLIANYEFLIDEDNLEELYPYCDEKTLLVLDESSYLKNFKSQRTKVTIELRKRCGRVVLLNGTPIANDLMDIFAQAYIMNPRILGFRSPFMFKSEYAILGGYGGKKIIGWRKGAIEEVQRKLAPFMLRRLKEDCLDLPKKLPSSQLTVTLTPKTWAVYKQMRDDLVAWMNKSTVVMAPQAITKIMRLAQITSGFIGGAIEDDNLDEQIDDEKDQLQATRPAWLPFTSEPVPADPNRDLLNFRSLTAKLREVGGEFPGTYEIGSEKLDGILDWTDNLFDIDKDLKLVIWCRFKVELFRLYTALQKRYPRSLVLKMHGGQKKTERLTVLKALDPSTAPKHSVISVGTGTGSMGLNFSSSHTVLYASNDYKLWLRKQSEDRNHRPGQIHNVSYTDVVAVGPNGQKTIDHKILKSLYDKDELATYTTSAWVSFVNRLKDE